MAGMRNAWQEQKKRRRYRRVFFRGSQNNKKIRKSKNNKISLPGYDTSSRNPAPTGTGCDFPERAAFCISGWLIRRCFALQKKREEGAVRMRKGSLTVEAAFALPLFFLTFVSLISLMGIYGEFSKKTVELQQSAEEYAVLLAYTDFGSTVPVRRLDTVKVSLPFLPYAVWGPRIRVAANVLPWTGRSDYDSLAVAQSDDGQLYYLSDYESVYHTSSCCSYLSLQISAVEADRIRGMRNHSGEKYHSCENCVGAGGVGSVVYVTENGEHYHNSPECSGLKRSVHLVEAEEVQGLHMCSRCSKREQAHENG